MCWVRRRLQQALCLCIIGGMLALPQQAAAKTALSRWVFDSAVPAIDDMFKRHPRYSDSQLEVRAGGNNALDAALANALRRGLGHRGVTLRQPLAPTDTGSIARSIDALQCDPAPVAEHRLLVKVQADGSLADVSLSLVDTAEITTALRNWQWRGRLAADERDRLRQPSPEAQNRGTLSAPWSENEAEAAAGALSRQLACALRPAVTGQLRLNWSENGTSGFYPTWLELRRRIGSFDEFADVDSAGDYQVAMRTEQVEPGVWQLWLDGVPLDRGLPAVQAVTYARGDAVSQTPARPQVAAVEVPPQQGSQRQAVLRQVPKQETVRYQASLRQAVPWQTPPQQPAAGDPASKYLQVSLLDAEQDATLPGRTTLRVRLRLSNAANRPLRYGLSLSGGHFRYCIAERDHYRHDRYGYLEGELGAGESTVRVMTIDGARHNPRPWFGMRRCAGFRDLDGFERFASQGHKVTQFIHWSQ